MLWGVILSPLGHGRVKKNGFKCDLNFDYEIDWSYKYVRSQSIPGNPVFFYQIFFIKPYEGGREAEIQLPLKRFPDSSVSSLIRTGWCGRASRHQKFAPIHMSE